MNAREKPHYIPGVVADQRIIFFIQAGYYSCYMNAHFLLLMDVQERRKIMLPSATTSKTSLEEKRGHKSETSK